VEGSSVALVGAMGVIVGAIIGFLIARFNGSSNSESELVAAREALDQYRADVADHFKRSSGLIAEMTNSYRNVYQHMADGAQQLCSAEVARSIGETLQTELLEDKRPAAPASDGAATTAAPVAAAAAAATTAAPVTTPQASDSAQSPAAQTEAAAHIGESTATLTDSGPDETSAAPAQATAVTEHASAGGAGADPGTARPDHSEYHTAKPESDDADTQATVLTRKAS